MNDHLHDFTRISISRMYENYLPKLKITLDGVDQELIWNHEIETLNSIVGCVTADWLGE